MSNGKKTDHISSYFLLSRTAKQAFQAWVFVRFLKSTRIFWPCYACVHVSMPCLLVTAITLQPFNRIHSPSIKWWTSPIYEIGSHFSDQQQRRTLSVHFPRSRLLRELIPHGTPENLRGNPASGCRGCPRAVKVHQQPLPGWDKRMYRQRPNF